MFKAFVFDNPLNLEVKDINKDGIFLNKEEYSIASYKLEHTTPCMGFVFKEADKRKIKTDFIAKIGIPHGPLLGKLQEGKDIIFNGKKINSGDIIVENFKFFFDIFGGAMYTLQASIQAVAGSGGG